MFVLKCIKNKIKILEYVSSNLKKDKEVVYNSVKNHGSELRYADDIFKKDKELVLIAVVTTGAFILLLIKNYKSTKMF